jgi:hypothetical protein
MYVRHAYLLHAAGLTEQHVLLQLARPPTADLVRSLAALARRAFRSLRDSRSVMSIQSAGVVSQGVSQWVMRTLTSLPAQSGQSSTPSSILLLRQLLTWSAVLPHLHVVPSGACVRRAVCRQTYSKVSCYGTCKVRGLRTSLRRHVAQTISPFVIVLLAKPLVCAPRTRTCRTACQGQPARRAQSVSKASGESSIACKQWCYPP